MNNLKQKYGIFTAASMVVGCVIGSGVFFKAEAISHITGGNAAVGVAAWIIGGIVMLTCLLMFTVFSSRYGNNGGIILFAQKTVGDTYAYYIGWFMATIYYPSLTGVLAWLSARYTLLFLGYSDMSGGLCMFLSALYLVLVFAQNALLPFFSGKLQVITTVIKLIPLSLMSVAGIYKGFATGVIHQNFISSARMHGAVSLFPAIASTAFAYEGWIAATSIGTELKNSKKNLPRALIVGGISIISIYVLYYLGITGAIESDVLVNYPAEGIKMAFTNATGELFGSFLTLFVAISCIGALNGLMMSSSRAMYNIAITGKGPAPKLFSCLAPFSAMPLPSCVAGLLFSMGWLFFYYGARIADKPLFGQYGFDISELCVVSIYAMYIPMFFLFMKRHYSENLLKNVFLPVLGILSCIIMIICAVWSHYRDLVDYLFAFFAVMLTGALFTPPKKRAASPMSRPD